MARLLTVVSLFILLVPPAYSDQLSLIDGRTFTGTVTTEHDTVLIDTGDGTKRFPRDQISQIEWMEPPQEQLTRKLTETSRDDPKGLYEVAKWAGGHDLTEQARELYLQIIELDPGHAGARRGLGQMKIDERWVAIEEGLELTRSKLEAGHYDELLSGILPSLQQIAANKTKRLAVGELLGETQLRAGQFPAATKTFTDLGAKAEGPAAVKYQGIAKILAANPDGMYVVREPYPPTVGLLKTNRIALEPGPASLTDPLVLQVALRDKAKKEIDAARDLLEVAWGLEADDPRAARETCAMALKAFDRADALAAKISYSYRVEIARRKIANIRKDTDDAAKKFDEVMGDLGKEELSPQGYRHVVSRLTRHLDKVQKSLEAILDLAKPHHRDLIVEIKWAESDLKKIKQMREDLNLELDENP